MVCVAPSTFHVLSDNVRILCLLISVVHINRHKNVNPNYCECPVHLRIQGLCVDTVSSTTITVKCCLIQ